MEMLYDHRFSTLLQNIPSGRLELNGTHQLMICADNLIILGEDINAIKNAGSLL
jgi:hypothetical protein